MLLNRIEGSTLPQSDMFCAAKYFTSTVRTTKSLLSPLPTAAKNVYLVLVLVAVLGERVVGLVPWE